MGCPGCRTAEIRDRRSERAPPGRSLSEHEAMVGIPNRAAITRPLEAGMETMDYYCCGKKLDTSSATFGDLRSANREILRDPVALRRAMAEDGYLFFRGLIDRDDVIEARREILLKYAVIGEIDSINHPL